MLPTLGADVSQRGDACVPREYGVDAIVCAESQSLCSGRQCHSQLVWVLVAQARFNAVSDRSLYSSTRRLFSGALLLISLFLLGCAQSTPAPQETTQSTSDLLIRNVTLIDTASGLRSGQDVRLRGDRIVAVTPTDPATSSTAGDAKVIDGTGKFVIPGLWDMHVHITYEPAISDAMADLFLTYGITSVRDTGALMDKITPYVAQWRAPGAVAPRLFYSGPLLDGANVVYDGDSRPEIGIANGSVEQAVANITRLKAAGVDFVKVYELVEPDVFEALVSAARSANLPIASHVPLAITADVAGPQVDSMEHLRNIELACAADADTQVLARRERIRAPGDVGGYDLRRALHAEFHTSARANIDEAKCDAVAASLQETIQVPTLRLNTIVDYPPYDRDDWVEHAQQLPQPARDTWLAGMARWPEIKKTMSAASGRWSLSLVKRLHEAGVPIGAGTDTPIGSALPGYSLHTELERLVDAGLSPMDALRAATVRPAEFFGLAHTMGNIEVDQVADLVLLDANPLDDIRNTRKIYKVISRGLEVAARQ